MIEDRNPPTLKTSTEASIPDTVATVSPSEQRSLGPESIKSTSSEIQPTSVDLDIQVKGSISGGQEKHSPNQYVSENKQPEIFVQMKKLGSAKATNVPSIIPPTKETQKMHHPFDEANKDYRSNDKPLTENGPLSPTLSSESSEANPEVTSTFHFIPRPSTETPVVPFPVNTFPEIRETNNDKQKQQGTPTALIPTEQSVEHKKGNVAQFSKLSTSAMSEAEVSLHQLPKGQGSNTATKEEMNKVMEQESDTQAEVGKENNITVTSEFESSERIIKGHTQSLTNIDSRQRSRTGVRGKQVSKCIKCFTLRWLLYFIVLMKNVFSADNFCILYP